MPSYAKTQSKRSGTAWRPNKHDWPALVEDVELPDGLKSRVAWFFKANPRFKHAFHTKWKDMARSGVTSTLAKQRETCLRCKHEQFLARDPFGYPFSERGTTFVWDACAQHRALTVTEEAKIETDVRAEWAEEAVNAAVWRVSLLQEQPQIDADPAGRAREAHGVVAHRRGTELLLLRHACPPRHSRKSLYPLAL